MGGPGIGIDAIGNKESAIFPYKFLEEMLLTFNISMLVVQAVTIYIVQYLQGSDSREAVFIWDKGTSRQ